MKTTSEVVVVTKEMADQWLARHYERVAEGQCKQRKVYKSIVNKYKADLTSGSWQKTPVPIIFDENGDLADGQHRLEAIKQTGIPVELYIARGWPTEVIDAIDRCKPRSVADQLHLHGKANGLVISSSVNAIIRICLRGSGDKAARPSVSYAMVNNILTRSGMDRHIDRIMEIMSKGKRAGRTVGPLALYRTINAKKADLFAEQLANMDFEKGTGPNLYARYLMLRNPDDQDLALRAISSAIRLWHNDETAEFIKPSFSAIDWLADANKKLRAQVYEAIGFTPPNQVVKDK